MRDLLFFGVFCYEKDRRKNLADFIKGMDISTYAELEKLGAKYYDNGVEREVLDILKNGKVYRTDENGSIMFKIKNKKLKIETCSSQDDNMNKIKEHIEKVFEDIKHIDENGNEYWIARELMALLEYSKQER